MRGNRRTRWSVQETGHVTGQCDVVHPVTLVVSGVCHGGEGKGAREEGRGNTNII